MADPGPRAPHGLQLPYAHVTNRFLKGRKPVTYLVIALLVLVLSLAWKIEVVLAGTLLLYTLSGPVAALFRRRARRLAAAEDPVGARGEGR